MPQHISRAVLVGTWRGPQDVSVQEGGREIRTTWGEMAWQLGGADAFDMIAANDARGIAPGSNLLEAISGNARSPCLILVDEWVAYLRQIYKVDGLPSGSFDANLSFVQSLTEAVKTSPGTLPVAALPASQIEAVVEQLTTLPGSEVTLKLEIDAEVPSGLDRAKIRTLIENANTLGFIEKTIK